MTPQKRGHWLRRSIIFGTVSLVLVVLLVRWTNYHVSHVISRQATVKGVVAQVGARIPGRVAEVLVQPNQRVHKGDVLARLDDEQVKAALENAVAALAKAKTDYDIGLKQLNFDREHLNLDVTLKDACVRASTAEVTTAKALAQQWANERKRIDSLTIPGVVTGSEKDATYAQAEGKAADLVAAKERLEEARLQQRLAVQALQQLAIDEAKLVALGQAVQMAEAGVKMAQADVAATVIRAPENGWVARQLTEAGGSVRIGDQIVAMWSGDSLWIEAMVDESALGDLKVGSPVDVYLASYPHQVVPGRVEALGVLSDTELLAAAEPRPLAPPPPSLLPIPINVAVRVAVLDPDIQLLPGLTAVVGIHSGYHNPARQWLPTSLSASLSSAWQFVSGIWRNHDISSGNQQTAGS
jgi:membrane fusion protein (multidrug efflux system)